MTQSQLEVDLSIYPSLTWHLRGLDVLLGGPERGCQVQRDDLLVVNPRHCHSFSQQIPSEHLPTYLPACLLSTKCGAQDGEAAERLTRACK